MSDLIRKETSPNGVPTGAAVVEGPNGPRIDGSRITVYDVYYYTKRGWGAAEIAELFKLTTAQILAAIDYIAGHAQEVEEVDRHAEERIARGHPPEVQAKLDAINAKYDVLWAHLSRPGTEVEGERDPA